MTSAEGKSWYTQLQEKIAKEILELKDLRGNYCFDSVDENLLKYFVKNIAELPWANHLALEMLVTTMQNLSPDTVNRTFKILSNRFKDIFSRFELVDFNEFDPDIHMYNYVKGEILADHSLNQRAQFLKRYNLVNYRVRTWVRRKASPDIADVLERFIFPTPSFDKRDFSSLQKRANEIAQQTRKLETSALTPLLPQIRAEGHFRRNQLLRLRNKVREVFTAAKENGWPLPIEFDYDESNGERFFFKLWDRPSFVLAHSEKYTPYSNKAASNKTDAYADKNKAYFVEFIRSERMDDGTVGEGLWFLELMKEDVLGQWYKYKSDDEIQKRLDFLYQWGYVSEEKGSYPVPFYAGHKGILVLGKFIAEAQKKVEGILFPIEPFYVAATFALLALNLFTSSGIRINELLQITHSQRCLVVTKDRDRASYILRLIPKGRDEPENFYVPKEIFGFMSEIIKLLGEHYSLSKTEPLPTVDYDYNGRKNMFGKDAYIFQFNERHFGATEVQSILRFLLHGIVIQTEEGGQVNVKPHLLRHAFATHAVQTEKLPIDVVREILHQKDVQVTGYYSQPTQGQIGQALNDLHDNWVSHIDIQQGILRGPEELKQFYDEYSQKVGTISKVVGGVCTTDAVCPTKMACVGCAAKVPRPEFKDEILDYFKWASESEERFKKLNLPLEAQKMKLAKNRARNELKEIQLIENYQRDEKYDPTIRITKPKR